MARVRFLALAVSLIVVSPALACEPVVPFMQVMVPALALSRSILVLAVAVVVKSALFAVFERRLPRLRAAWRMFLGNVLTSFVGLLVAVMMASGAGIWFIGVPLVCLLCWLPSRRLVKVAPLAWLARISPTALAGIMTSCLLASCVLFMAGQEDIRNHQLRAYWITKVVAIFLALLASVTLTTVWEEWVIWRLSSSPEGPGFFGSVLRTNLYVLVLVMAVPAALILPKRLKSPDFLAKRPSPAVAQTIAPSQ
jgi:heme/copper-type cytochrome/quinol oxidase subunit 3